MKFALRSRCQVEWVTNHQMIDNKCSGPNPGRSAGLTRRPRHGVVIAALGGWWKVQRRVGANSDVAQPPESARSSRRKGFAGSDQRVPHSVLFPAPHPAHTLFAQFGHR